MLLTDLKVVKEKVLSSPGQDHPSQHQGLEAGMCLAHKIAGRSSGQSRVTRWGVEGNEITESSGSGAGAWENAEDHRGYLRGDLKVRCFIL